MDDHLPVFVLNGYENLTLFKVLYLFGCCLVLYLLCWTTINRASRFSRTWTILSWTTWALSTPARFKHFIFRAKKKIFRAGAERFIIEILSINTIIIDLQYIRILQKAENTKNTASSIMKMGRKSI